jgi:hypothetical protein
MAAKPKKPKPLTKKQEAAEKTYRAIGRFMFEFSQLEYEIRYRLSEVLDVALWYFNEAMVHDFSALCNAAKSAFDFEYSKATERPKFKELEKLLNRALDFSRLRNAVAHGLWVPFEKGGSLIYVQRGKFKGTVKTGQAEALEKKADEALAIRVAIAKICDEGYRDEAKPKGRVWR